MATGRVIQPLLNPIKLVDMNPELVSAYLSRHMDDFFYQETIYPWQQKRFYAQPWQNSDTIALHLQADITPLVFSIIDIDERVYYSAFMNAGAYDFDDPTLNIYQISYALTDLVEGIYFVRVECGASADIVLVSEPLHVAQVHKFSLLLGYSNDVPKDDLIFGYGFAPYIRIRATLRLKTLSSKDTLFEDQPLNMTMLLSRPFRVWELKIGGASGIPDYLADILNRVFGCKTLTIDGKPYTKADGAKMEDTSQPNYPMRGWSIDLREAQNITSRTFGVGPGGGGSGGAGLLFEDGGAMLFEDGSPILLEG